MNLHISPKMFKLKSLRLSFDILITLPLIISLSLLGITTTTSSSTDCTTVTAFTIKFKSANGNHSHSGQQLQGHTAPNTISIGHTGPTNIGVVPGLMANVIQQNQNQQQNFKFIPLTSLRRSSVPVAHGHENSILMGGTFRDSWRQPMATNSQNHCQGAGSGSLNQFGQQICQRSQSFTNGHGINQNVQIQNPDTVINRSSSFQLPSVKNSSRPSTSSGRSPSMNLGQAYSTSTSLRPFTSHSSTSGFSTLTSLNGFNTNSMILPLAGKLSTVSNASLNQNLNDNSSQSLRLSRAGSKTSQAGSNLEGSNGTLTLNHFEGPQYTRKLKSSNTFPSSNKKSQSSTNISYQGYSTTSQQSPKQVQTQLSTLSDVAATDSDPKHTVIQPINLNLIRVQTPSYPRPMSMSQLSRIPYEPEVDINGSRRGSFIIPEIEHFPNGNSTSSNPNFQLPFISSKKPSDSNTNTVKNTNSRKSTKELPDKFDNIDSSSDYDYQLSLMTGQRF